jgi:hypothetical protein
MTNNPNPPVRTPAPDEKAGQIMVYMRNSICWGDVIVKSQIRISTWLRTNAAPDFVAMYNAKVLTTTTNISPKPLSFTEMHVDINEIMAYHLVPPAKDPIDYDASEPNRRMVPISVVVSAFKFDGFMRMAGKTDLAKYIEVTRELYTPLYDVEVTCPMIPALGTIKVPYVLIRQSGPIYAYRTI